VATIATLVVDMQANTAQFTKTWDATGDRVRKGSGAFKDAEKAALGFAQKGLGAITGGVPGAANALEKLTSAMLKSQSALVRFGGGALLAVASFKQAWDLGLELGELVREQILPALTGQQSTEQFLESMKKAQEEERKFLEERKASVNLIRDMERSKAQAYTEAAVARAKADGDESAAVQAQLNGRLQAIEQEKAARVAQALEATKHTQDAVLRERLITAAVQEESAKKSAAYAIAAAEFTRIDTERSLKALENIKKEADANQAAIDKAVTAREKISQQGSAAAQALNVSGITNVDKVRQFGQNLEAVAKKFHMLREEGVPYRDLSASIDTATGELTTEFKKLRDEVGANPAAVDLLDRTWAKFNFGNIQTNIENQRQAFEDQGFALTQVNDLIARQRDLLQVELPDAARRAGASVDDLNGRVRRLEDSFNAANKEMREFDRLAAQAQQ
jgi:hypothetical protein